MLLLSTRSLSGHGLDKVFALAKSAGCDGIDLSVDFTLFDTVDAMYLLELSKRHELPIVSVTAPARRVTKRQSGETVELADLL
jgi:sugar phosphate isomerase/epimerase